MSTQAFAISHHYRFRVKGNKLSGLELIVTKERKTQSGFKKVKQWRFKLK